MIASWPSTLPLPDRQTYGKQPDEARIRRRPDSGPPGSRGRFSSAARQVALSIDIDRNQKAVFDRFFQHELAEGSLPFTMPDPTTHGWQLFTAAESPLLTVDGTPIALAATWLCLFGDGLPSEAIRGVRFQISFQIAVMP
ncbi:hypothetical protein K1718_13370 [Roseibium porphyridii]|uniref:Uncharacterized protein n=1 Tax=Roseibium porphyridii TaxID=2866279 RepID=A0ABY8FA73_9HYPH|nr:hypothetical protein [Roseibium sp. KMA01]WFE92309.1 hypothetical protein K1718_13370 [Roseibium sp. KMA01]